MKIETHQKKIERFERTMAKLNPKEDSETLIEDYMLTASHFINAAMHKLGTLREDKDIKHNQLFGFLKRESLLKDKSEEVSSLIQEIEQLRPSYVYGKGENGNAAKKAEEAFNKVRSICKGIVEEDKKDEGKPENSN